MRKGSSLYWPALTLAVIVVGMALHPSDTPWFFDMSRNFNLALQFNHTPAHVLGMSLPFTPSPYALKGTHGIRYGPVPVWIDQVFLSFTHNLLVMTVTRTILVAGLTSVALLWLTQLIGVSAWLAVLTMLSPWMWYYSRELWDNSLDLPACTLMLAAYLQFVATKRSWPVCAATFFAVISCLIHLIAAPFAAVLFFHALVFERAALWKVKWPLLATLVVMFGVSSPYLHYVVTFHGSTVAENTSKWRGWIFALMGAQHLTAWKVGYFLEQNLHSSMPRAALYVFRAAQLVTCLAFLWCVIGMLAAIAPALRALAKKTSATMFEHWCLIGLSTVAVQTLFDGIEHVYYHPHYYNTTWVVFAMFVWMGIGAMPRILGSRNCACRWCVPTYAVALIICGIMIRWQILRNGGSKGDHYNALLGNQIEVAREVNAFSDASPVDIEITYWNDRKDTFPVLRQIVGTPTGERPMQRVVVRFRDGFPGDSRVIVESFPLASSF